MKIKSKILAILILSLYLTECFGQVDKLNLVVNYGPSYTSLKNKIIDNKQSWENGYSANMCLNYTLNSLLSVSTGFGFSNYSSSMSVNETYFEKPMTDDENDNYLYRIYGNKIAGDQSIEMFEIPLIFTLQRHKELMLNPLLQIGIKASIPSKTRYNCSEGIVRTTGFYEKYNVELSDMPNHGFETIEFKGLSGEMSTRTAFSMITEIGCDIKTGYNCFRVSAYYTQSLTSNSKSFDVFNKHYPLQSLNEPASKICIRAFGVRFGFLIPFSKRY
jgi:hypothetical protein